jgi:hypothetical protein
LSIAVDKHGQAYVTGETYSTDFPINNALQSVLNGNSDAFVAQLSIDGAMLRYSTYLGGRGYDGGYAIAVDKWGRPYVTGSTTSSDFPIKNALQPTWGGSEDGFVAQLTADGSELGYATYLGGRSRDGGFNIAVDQLGQAYVTGGTFSTDFPTKNALQPIFGGDLGDVDAFVTKISADGTAFHYSTYLGGSKFDACEGIAVDEHGQATVTGRTQSLDFPTKNALQPTFGGGFHDVFVTQFTADGAALRYSTYLGGDGEDLGSGIVLNKQGEAYVTGGTGSTDFPTKNAIQPALGGNTDIFVAKFSADGAALRYSTYLGGNNGDGGTGIAVDTQGQAYVTGTTSSSDFPTLNALEPALNDFSDAFVAKIGNDERSCEHGKKCKDDH